MSNTIKIDRDKLETALKRKFKTDRKKTISRALGFKDNALGEALKRGTLSLKMVRALEIFDIKRISYEVDDTAPEETEQEPEITVKASDISGKQISIDELETMRRDELKSLIKEAVIELVKETEIRICNNPINHSYTAYIRVNGELVKKVEEVLL